MSLWTKINPIYRKKPHKINRPLKKCFSNSLIKTIPQKDRLASLRAIEIQDEILKLGITGTDI